MIRPRKASMTNWANVPYEIAELIFKKERMKMTAEEAESNIDAVQVIMRDLGRGNGLYAVYHKEVMALHGYCRWLDAHNVPHNVSAKNHFKIKK